MRNIVILMLTDQEINICFCNTAAKILRLQWKVKYLRIRNYIA